MKNSNNGYCIKILKKKNKYYFQLWYRGKQAMGESIEYKTKNDCLKAISFFKSYLIENEFSINNALMKIEKTLDKKYVYIFYNKNEEKIYSSRKIEKRQSCENSLISTCKNFNNAKIFNERKKEYEE